MSTFDSPTVPPIAKAEAGLAIKGLPRPLQLGATRIERREYAAVRIVTEDGAVGSAYCLTRDAPVREVLDRMLLPGLTALSGLSVAEAFERVLRSTALVGRVGLVRRALGLVEIALQDIAAQQAGLPVWQVVGAGAVPRPTVFVACYPTPDRTVDELAAEVLSAAAEGWPLVKISRSADAVLMRDLLAVLGRELPASSRLIVDAGFGWRSADEAVRDLEVWDAPELAWLEDPFLPEDLGEYERLKERTAHRIGVGDEVTDPTVLTRLGDAGMDVIRVDVVALGGIGPTSEAVARARLTGTEVSSHVYPEVSVHLGTMVETFARSGPGANRYDPAPSLIRGGPRFEHGTARVPDRPGLGFDLDWAAFGL